MAENIDNPFICVSYQHDLAAANSICQQISTLLREKRLDGNPVVLAGYSCFMVSVEFQGCTNSPALDQIGQVRALLIQAGFIKPEPSTATH